MPQVKSVKDADVKDKRVLVRVDFNVPLKDGKVLDDTRLKAVVPTLEFLHKQGASKIIILTHAGRPGGKVDEALRAAPIEARLRELTKAPFEMRENLRFDAREEKNDEGFARELAALGDIFVNDAFADSHRSHASIVGIPKFLPSFAGLLMEEEVKNLSEALTPQKGSIAILGGAKLETKLPLIEKLSPLYEKVFVGGALANEYKAATANVVLPVDGVPERKGMLDIGPQTIEEWSSELLRAPFVLWNGPVGMFEKEEYRKGTEALAHVLVSASPRAIVGGGDTIAALSKFSFNPERIFVSTGGGAMLQFLTTGTLPGIEALKG